MILDNQTALCNAYRLAQRSNDPSTQNAAILFTDKGITIGINEFPIGVSETTERWERPLKYSYVEHAERNAIYQAASTGTVARDGVMVCPWAACPDCARAIIQVELRELVVHQQALDRSPPNWSDPVSLALDMLDEAGVKVTKVSAKLDVPPIRHSGGLFHP